MAVGASKRGWTTWMVAAAQTGSLFGQIIIHSSRYLFLVSYKKILIICPPKKENINYYFACTIRWSYGFCKPYVIASATDTT